MPIILDSNTRGIIAMIKEGGPMIPKQIAVSTRILALGAVLA